MSRNAMAFTACVTIVAAVAASAGCGRPTAAVEGTVTYRGRPVPNGIVAVFVGDGQVVTGGIAEGRFAIDGVSPGRAVVTVQCDTPANPSIKPPPDEKIFSFDNPALPKRGGPPVAIPSRYGDPKTSPLRLEVSPGNQIFDVVLTDE